MIQRERAVSSRPLDSGLIALANVRLYLSNSFECASRLSCFEEKKAIIGDIDSRMVLTPFFDV